jgi:hypothetical protein
MQADVQDALVISDSVRRDLDGAIAAELPCLLARLYPFFRHVNA